MPELTHFELWGYRTDDIRFPADDLDDGIFEWARLEHADRLYRQQETFIRIGVALGVHRSTAKRYVRDYRYLKRQRRMF